MSKLTTMEENQEFFKSNVARTDFFHNTIHTVLEDCGDTVVKTYGPYGTHNIISEGSNITSLKDGKKVFDAIEYPENSIAADVKKALSGDVIDMVLQNGDGTTTFIRVLGLFYKRIRAFMKDEIVAPSVLNRSMSKIKTILIDKLDEYSVPLSDDDLYKVINTSVDDREDLAMLVYNVFEEINKQSLDRSIDPKIIVERVAADKGHSFELIAGLEAKGSIILPEYSLKQQNYVNFKHPKVLMVDGCFDITPEVLLSLNQHLLSTSDSLIVLASSVTEELLTYMKQVMRASGNVFNKLAIIQTMASIQVESYIDMATVVGASIVREGVITRKTKILELLDYINDNSGYGKEAEIYESYFKLIEPKINTEVMTIRLKEVKKELNELDQDDYRNAKLVKRLRERLGILSANYGKLYVSGESYQRTTINYELVADAVPQVLSAKKHGIVPGFNTTVLKIISELDKSILDDINYGHKLIKIIYDCYMDLCVEIVNNKYKDIDIAVETTRKHFEENGFIPLDIRTDKPTMDIINSANTDKMILNKAMDKALLLATSDSFMGEFIKYDVWRGDNQEIRKWDYIK